MPTVLLLYLIVVVTATATSEHREGAWRRYSETTARNWWLVRSWGAPPDLGSGMLSGASSHSETRGARGRIYCDTRRPDERPLVRRRFGSKPTWPANQRHITDGCLRQKAPNLSGLEPQHGRCAQPTADLLEARRSSSALSDSYKELSGILGS